MSADMTRSVTGAGGTGKSGPAKKEVISNSDLMRIVEQDGNAPNGMTALKALEKRKLTAAETSRALVSKNYNVKLIGVKNIGRLDTLTLMAFIESVGENNDPDGTAAMKELEKRQLTAPEVKIALDCKAYGIKLVGVKNIGKLDTLSLMAYIEKVGENNDPDGTAAMKELEKRQLTAPEVKLALNSKVYGIKLIGVKNIGKLGTLSLMAYIEKVGENNDPDGTAAMKALENRQLATPEVKLALNSAIYGIKLIGVKNIGKLDTASLINHILSVGEHNDPDGTAAMKELEKRKLNSDEAKLALGSKNYSLMLLGLKYLGKIDTMYLIGYAERVGVNNDPDGTAIMKELDKRQLSSEEAKRALDSEDPAIRDIGIKFIR